MRFGESLIAPGPLRHGLWHSNLASHFDGRQQKRDEQASDCDHNQDFD
jgi:hypothetical protein